MGEAEASGSQVGQHGRRRAGLEPSDCLVGSLGCGQAVVEGGQVGADGASRTEQLAEAAAELAAHTRFGREQGGLTTARAGLPKRRVRSGAGGTEGMLRVAAPNGTDLSTSGAAGPAFLTGQTPRLAGGLGDLGWPGATTDRTGHFLDWPTARAARAIGTAHAHRPARATAGADFLVGGVSNKAVRTDRPPLVVTGGGIPDRSAARTRHGP